MSPPRAACPRCGRSFLRLIAKAHHTAIKLAFTPLGTRSELGLERRRESQQQLGKKDLRHRSNTPQVIVPADLKRFKDLGVIASMQPTHCTTDMRFCERRIGPERSKNGYVWRSLLNSAPGSLSARTGLSSRWIRCAAFTRGDAPETSRAVSRLAAGFRTRG